MQMSSWASLLLKSECLKSKLPRYEEKEVPNKEQSYDFHVSLMEDVSKNLEFHFHPTRWY